MSRQVGYWRTDRSVHGVAVLDELRELAACDPVLAADFLEIHDRVPDGTTTRAEALIAAACALVAVVLRSSVERRAITIPIGCGQPCPFLVSPPGGRWRL